MSEPISSGAAAGYAGAAAFKSLGGPAVVAAVASGLAAIVVMLMMRPKSTAEWAVALISTLVSSIAGGAAVVLHWGLHGWATDYFGLVALFGLVFACGLPGWAVVRWVFAAIERRKNADIVDVIKEAREAM